MTAVLKALSSTPDSDKRAYRFSEIDMIRGLVIVIMAIDHVRDNFFVGALQDPTTDPTITAGVFATRWITHFCAPVFVLLAGTSAGLMATRKSRPELAVDLRADAYWRLGQLYVDLNKAPAAAKSPAARSTGS